MSISAAYKKWSLRSRRSKINGLTSRWDRLLGYNGSYDSGTHGYDSNFAARNEVIIVR